MTSWGLSVSGKTVIPRWDRRDNLLIQANYGKGYGHYINDLNSIGQADAIFDPETGELEVLSVVAMYIALQKWWSTSMRSNFSYGYVDVDNVDSQGPDAYHQTNRYSAEFIWPPTAGVDMGVELLYGKRMNKDGLNVTAKQLQNSALYHF